MSVATAPACQGKARLAASWGLPDLEAKGQGGLYLVCFRRKESIERICDKDVSRCMNVMVQIRSR